MKKLKIAICALGAAVMTGCCLDCQLRSTNGSSSADKAYHVMHGGSGRFCTVNRDESKGVIAVVRQTNDSASAPAYTAKELDAAFVDVVDDNGYMKGLLFVNCSDKGVMTTRSFGDIHAEVSMSDTTIATSAR